MESKKKKIKWKATPAPVTKTTQAKKKEGDANAVFDNQQARGRLHMLANPLTL